MHECLLCNLKMLYTSTGSKNVFSKYKSTTYTEAVLTIQLFDSDGLTFDLSKPICYTQMYKLLLYFFSDLQKQSCNW